MSRSIHVRLDEDSGAALDLIRGGAMTDSEAVRTALKEGASSRLARAAIRGEVDSVASDEADRSEMGLIREQMDELAPTEPR